jgi:hypothetical protein
MSPIRIPPIAHDDDADLDPNDDPEVGRYQGILIGEVGTHNADGTTTWRQRSLSIRFHHYASGVGIVEAVSFMLRNDAHEWRSFPLDHLASSSLWDAVFTQVDWQGVA